MSVLRILFLNDHPLYANGLAAGLAQIGHDVRIYNPGLVTQARQGQGISEQLRTLRPDIVLSIGHLDHYMNGHAVCQAIRQSGAYHVYWATEDRPFHMRISMTWARYARAVFTLDAASIPAYQALGLPAEVLPFACNPAIHRCYPGEALVHDIVLIANNTPNEGTFRQQSLLNLLQPLIGGGYDLAVWGYDWHKPFAPGKVLPARFYRGRLSYDQAVKAVSSAKIVLGPQWDAISPTQVSCRTFETLGAAGFLLTSDVPGIHHYFRNGHHLLTSDSPECTKAMVDHFLCAEGERRSIALQGQQFVYGQHTYFHRACQFTAAVLRWRG